MYRWHLRYAELSHSLYSSTPPVFILHPTFYIFPFVPFRKESFRHVQTV